MNTRTLLLAIQYASIMGLFFECWIIFKRLKTPAHSYLLISTIAALLNNTGYLLEIKSQSVESYIVALKFSYLGRTWYAFFIFLFIAELTGFRIADLHKRIMMMTCAAIYCVIYTIPANGLYYTSLQYESSGLFPRLNHGNGIVHHLNMGIQFLFIFLAIVFLCVALKYESRKVRKMCYLTLVCAIVIQAIFLLVQLTGISELTRSYDVTMIGFFIGTIMMLIAILSFDLLGTTEMAKEFIIDRISEGIIAVDNDGILQYYNEPAAKLYPQLQKVSFGQRKKEKTGLDEAGEVIEKLQQAVKSRENIICNDRVYALEENRLLHNGKQYGTLYALVDETEHIRYTEELEKQKEIADNANRAKSQFLANMSHEIRTPINAVLGMDEMILRETTEQNIRSYAGNIKAAGRTLLSLINDILDLSKVEEGKMEIIPVTYDGNYTKRYEETGGEAATYQESFHAPEARILVVDDTEMNLTVMENLLKHTQLQIDCVLTGKEGVQLALDTPYDILFIDHMMSEMDGLETLKQIREKGVNTRTPAVVLTANAVSGAREQYLKAGFDEYLSKPVDGDSLEKMIVSLLPKEKVMAVEKEQEVPVPEKLSWLCDIPEIDEKNGLKYCGSEEGYLSVLRVFHQTAEDKADEIARFYEAGDLEEYTIRVHALKSSSRIIGADELSKFAERLEKAGKENDRGFIDENTKPLLSMYRRLNERLSPLDERGQDLPELSEAELKDAYATIAEIARVMDFGMMEDVLQQLHGYKLSEKDAEILNSLEKCFIELDWDDMIRIVKPLL